MALAPQNQDAFFREVDEEVRRDRFAGFWRRWGRQLAVAIALGLAALAGWLYWQHRREEQAGAQGEALSQVLADVGAGKDAGAAARLAPLAAASHTGYADAARLAQAGLVAAKGDGKAAAAAFGRIATDAAAPQTVRELALVRQTALEFDTLPPATVVGRLLPYAVADSPWFGSAGEMVAMAYLKENKPAEAGRMFAAIATDRQVPETIRARAVRIAGMLGADVGGRAGGSDGTMTKFRRGAFARTLLAMGMVAAMSGCGVFKGDKKVRTPVLGNRIPVLTSEAGAQLEPALAAVPVSVPPAVANEAWAQPGGNAAKAPGNLALGAAPQKLWSARIVGTTPGARLGAAPVVADGRVFVVDTHAMLHAFDAGTGAAVWSSFVGKQEDERGRDLITRRPKGNAGALFGGGVSFAEGKVYATSGLGDVEAFEAATGKPLWTKRPGGPLRGAPTIAQGNLYVMSQDNQIYALAEATGDTVWNESGTLEASGVFGTAAPAAAQGTVVTGFSSGELSAYRYENGRAVWQDTLSRTSISTSVSTLSDVDADPVIDQGRVYAVGAGGRMVAMELVTGQRLWELNIAGIDTPWVAGDWLFVLTDEQKLLCIARTNGKVRWISQLPRYRKEKNKKGRVAWNGPVLAGDRLIVTGSEGLVKSVALADGTADAGFKAGKAFTFAPVVANGTMYLLADDGTLSAWR